MPSNDVSNREILTAVQGVQNDLKAINGRLRETEQDVARLKPLAEEVMILRRKADVHQKWNSVLTLGEIIIAGLLTALGIRPDA